MSWESAEIEIQFRIEMILFKKKSLTWTSGWHFCVFKLPLPASALVPLSRSVSLHVGPEESSIQLKLFVPEFNSVKHLSFFSYEKSIKNWFSWIFSVEKRVKNLMFTFKILTQTSSPYWKILLNYSSNKGLWQRILPN